MKADRQDGPRVRAAVKPLHRIVEQAIVLSKQSRSYRIVDKARIVGLLIGLESYLLRQQQEITATLDKTSQPLVLLVRELGRALGRRKGRSRSSGVGTRYKTRKR